MAEVGNAPVDVFASHLLEQFEVDDDGDKPVLTCTACVSSLCDVEVGDTLRVLLNTALSHALNDCKPVG